MAEKKRTVLQRRTHFQRIRAAAQERQIREGKDNAFVTLTVNGKQGERTYARLFGATGPLGQIVAENVGSSPATCSAEFQADDVIRACDAGLAALEAEEKGA